MSHQACLGGRWGEAPSSEEPLRGALKEVRWVGQEAEMGIFHFF